MAQPPSHGRGPVLLVLQLRLARRPTRAASVSTVDPAGLEILRMYNMPSTKKIIKPKVSSYKHQAKASSNKRQASSDKQEVSSLKPQATSSRILEPENVL